MTVTTHRHSMDKAASCVLGTVSILLALVLQGCGGGSAPRDALDSTEEAARPADVSPASAGLPTAYRLTFQDTLAGGASTPFYRFPEVSGGRIFDTQGRFAASLGAPVSLPHAIVAPPVERQGDALEEWSHAGGLSPDGLFVGTTYDATGVSRGFATFAQTPGTHFMPANTTADFVSDRGIVGGETCPGGGQPPACPDGPGDAIHWRPLTGRVTHHPGFEPVWMNDAGRMLGYQRSLDGTRWLATVDADGIAMPLGFDAEAGFTAQARFIADDGKVFLNVMDDPLNPRAGYAVVLLDDCVPLTVGRVGVRPAICEQRQCMERTRFTAFSAAGHAVGEHAWIYVDDAGHWQFAAETGFHWSARDGSTAIAGAGTGLPYLVNANGWVIVGGPAVRTPDSQGDAMAEPYLWKKGAGAAALTPILFPDADAVAPEDSVRVIALGDGGHLLVGVKDPLELVSGLFVFEPDSRP